MIVTVASFKGGVGKTTTAVHLSSYFQQKAPTLLIDGDPNRSATGWARRGELPFTVVDERQAARFSREFEHIVIDTQAHRTREDLEALAQGCDLLVIPATPDSLSLDALLLLVEHLEHTGADRFQILLTIIPPKPSRVGEEARESLSGAHLQLFTVSIPRFMAFQRAALIGCPVYAVNDPYATSAWNHYEAVGAEILP